jgi:hypothetical protein
MTSGAVVRLNLKFLFASRKNTVDYPIALGFSSTIIAGNRREFTAFCTNRLLENEHGDV